MKQKFYASLALLVFILGFAHCGDKKLPPVSGKDAELTRCLQYSQKKQYKEAVDCLEVYRSRYQGEGGDDADLYIGDNYFRQKEYLLAAETYQQFLKDNSYHPKQDYAYFKSGMAYYLDAPKSVDRDLGQTDLAAQNLAIVGRYFPSSPYANDAASHHQKALAKMAAKEFYVARFYYKYGEYLASMPRFDKILREYPGVGYDEQSFYYLIMAGIKTNQPEFARQVFLAFEQRYPQSKWVQSARQKLLSATN